MKLQIRDPRAHDLAHRLARLKGLSPTEAVIAALEAELARSAEQQPLPGRVAEIAADLRDMAQPGGRDLSKDEVDALWG